MFLEQLWLLKRVSLLKYLEKGDFSWYDFFVEKNHIKNWRDLLSFLDLFIEYKCFKNNIIFLELLLTDIVKEKSIIIIYEASLLNTNDSIKNILFKYKNFLTIEFFEFKWTYELLEKTSDLISKNWNNIKIYNSVNNFLWNIEKKESFNFLLELLDVKNKKYFNEIELIFKLLSYTSNKSLFWNLEDIVYYLLYDYSIENTLDDKYFYSISYILINALSDKKIDYKLFFIKNMFNYIWKKNFYEKFIKNSNSEVKEFLFDIVLVAINNTNNVDKVIEEIKKSLIDDKKWLNNIVKNFKKDFEYKEQNNTNNFIESLINEI